MKLHQSDVLTSPSPLVEMQPQTITEPVIVLFLHITSTGYMGMIPVFAAFC